MVGILFSSSNTNSRTNDHIIKHLLNMIEQHVYNADEQSVILNDATLDDNLYNLMHDATGNREIKLIYVDEPRITTDHIYDYDRTILTYEGASESILFGAENATISVSFIINVTDIILNTDNEYDNIINDNNNQLIKDDISLKLQIFLDSNTIINSNWNLRKAFPDLLANLATSWIDMLNFKQGNVSLIVSNDNMNNVNNYNNDKIIELYSSVSLDNDITKTDNNFYDHLQNVLLYNGQDDQTNSIQFTTKFPVIDNHNIKQMIDDNYIAYHKSSIQIITHNDHSFDNTLTINIIGLYDQPYFDIDIGDHIF